MVQLNTWVFCFYYRCQFSHPLWCSSNHIQLAYDISCKVPQHTVNSNHPVMVNLLTFCFRIPVLGSKKMLIFANCHSIRSPIFVFSLHHIRKYQFFRFKTWTTFLSSHWSGFIVCTNWWTKVNNQLLVNRNSISPCDKHKTLGSKTASGNRSHLNIWICFNYQTPRWNIFIRENNFDDIFINLDCIFLEWVSISTHWLIVY